MPNNLSLTAILIAVVLLTACADTPTAPTTWAPDRVREQLFISNLNSGVFGSPARTTRWRTPIPVSTSGLAAVEMALSHYEQWTSGVLRFTRVSQPPANGITFVDGGAVPQASHACGSIGEVQSPTAPTGAVFEWDATGAIIGSYTIHLGTDDCDDETAGNYPSAVAEHLLAHALGVIEHFDGFQNRLGLDDPRLLAVVYNLYANPVGVSANDLTVWGVR
jgi:hypothetical protein